MCYVLEKVYKVPRTDIEKIINDFISLDNINLENKDTIRIAISLYNSRKLDIVDCMLYAYSKNEDYDVYTFDKKLDKIINV